MTANDGDGTERENLDALRKEIDDLQSIPEEQLISPTPADLLDEEPTPHPTNAVGSEQWNKSVDEETLDD